MIKKFTEIEISPGGKTVSPDPPAFPVGPPADEDYTVAPTVTTAPKSYTLIDNFDKFDLDTYDQMLGISKFSELSAPLLRTVTVDTEAIEVSNYKTPFVYRWEVRPDLLRFLTNRRFYLSHDRTLEYPPISYLWTPDVLKYVDAESSLNPLEGNNFLISLIRPFLADETFGPAINVKLDNNFALTDSKIGWASYFYGTGKFGNTAIGPYNEVYTIPNFEWGWGTPDYSWVLKLLDAMSDVYRAPTVDAHRLNLNLRVEDLVPGIDMATGADPSGFFEGSPSTWQPNPAKYPTFLNNLDLMTDLGYQPQHGQGVWPEAFAMYGVGSTTLALNHLISRLTSFAYVSFWTGSPGEPHLPNGIQFTKHLYFVGDFPIGSPNRMGMQPEDQYINTRQDLLSFTPSYNFYSPLTEDFSPNVVTTERQLPNIYTFYSYLTTKSNMGYYEKVLSLGQPQTLDKQNFKLHDYYRLINTVAPVEASSLGDYVPSVIDRYKKVVFGKDLEILKATKSIRDKFPYNIQIDLPNLHYSHVMKKFADADAVDLFTTLLANYFIAPWEAGVGTTPTDIHKFIMLNMPSLGGVTPSLTDIQILDFSDLIEKIKTFSALKYTNAINDYLCIKFGQIKPGGYDNSNTYAAQLSEILPDHVNMVTKQEILGIEGYMKKKALSLWDIYNGKKCHTEVLVFEIAKYKINEYGEKESIQNIFIPNISTFDDALSYIDTQVFPTQVYSYEVYAHTLMIGSMYEFSRNPPVWPTTTNVMVEEGTEIDQDGNLVTTYNEVLAETKSGEGNSLKQIPSVVFLPPIRPDDPDKPAGEQGGAPRPEVRAIIVRAPYYNTTSLGTQEQTIVTSKPPLAPDIAFYPYKGVADKILILLNQNFGTRTMLPLPVFEGDSEKIQKQFTAQQYNKKPPGYLTYKSDDYRGTWEIYRTTKEPLEITDFSDVVPTRIESLEKSGYEDIIMPNTDYYYMARFVDLHDNISNPTGIFYLRMVDQEGFPPFLLLKAYTITDSKRNLITKRFKKFIKIKLKDSIRSVEGISGETANMAYQLGGSKELNKYKFRITSLKTGKQIDINVDFSKKIFGTHGTMNPYIIPSQVTEEMITNTEGSMNINLTNETVDKDMISGHGGGPDGNTNFGQSDQGNAAGTDTEFDS